jgi:hypothetical protein
MGSSMRSKMTATRRAKEAATTAISKERIRTLAGTESFGAVAGLFCQRSSLQLSEYGVPYNWAGY